eukprot:GHRR01015537.1.p1 GENE.GHRR01015537.1~~GHRR01015537.1.p1  ORF type:complete len:230 (+),score=37.35 GHRR01015537.1:55-744(+)
MASLHAGQARCFGRQRPRITRTPAVVQCSCSCSGASPSSSTNRRTALLTGVTTATGLALVPYPAAAVGFKKELKKRKISLDEYALSDLDGLRFYDNEQGRGKKIQKGDRVLVHFDCRFKGIDAVSSRYARTLGGNRTIAEPYEFVAGEPVAGIPIRKAGDSAGGLFAGTSGPKPPPALSTAVIGMKPGGRRTVYVDKPELGYVKGNQEIPAGAAFELQVEILSSVAASS